MNQLELFGNLEPVDLGQTFSRNVLAGEFVAIQPEATEQSQDGTSGFIPSGKWTAIFRYADGELYWRNPRVKSKAAAKKPVGTEKFGGYKQVGIRGRKYYLHRIIYEMFHGEIPENVVVDHIDGNPRNSRIENLRLATRSQNACNIKLDRSKFASNFPGVYFREFGKTGKPKIKPWIASITLNGKRHHLGYFFTEAEAVKARRMAEIRFHGQFANRGKD